MKTTHTCTQYCWPFTTEDNPLKPWTPEDHKRWAEDKLKNVPPSPLMWV